MQALVASYGYAGLASTIFRQTTPGWRLAIHFDDRLTIAPDGRGQFAVRAVAEIGAADSHDSKAVHLTLQKTALRQAAHEWIWLSLEIDVIVPDGMQVDDLRARPRFLGRLRALMEDVLAMLDALPDSSAEASPGPRLRVEARLLGDLFVCRNGFVSGKGADTDIRYRAACRSACTWMAYILLPEFAAMLRLEDLASQSATGRERVIATRSNSGDPRQRNNLVANRAQMDGEARTSNTGGKALKQRGFSSETVAQDDMLLPQGKSGKRNETKSARGVSKNGTALPVGEISEAGVPQATEITTIDGVVNSLGSPRRKSRLTSRPRALLHT
jgi:hypothetical protein